MDISDLLISDRIVFDESLITKDELFERAASLFETTGVVKNTKKFKKDLFKREAQTSTGIEDGFGIPHTKSKYVNSPALAFLRTGIIDEYEALDGSKVSHAFVIAVPQKSSDEHLIILSQLSRKLMDEEVREDLKLAKNAKEVLAALEK